MPGPGAWDDFFFSLCREKGASEHVVRRRQELGKRGRPSEATLSCVGHVGQVGLWLQGGLLPLLRGLSMLV